VDRTNGLGPAEASAHRSDEVVIAHEKLVVMHVVHVVSVDNATLVSAGKREALVSGANMSTARVKGAELGLGKGGAGVAAVLGSNLDVAGALLLGTEETGTGGLASASLGAGAPRGPVGNDAILGARLLVALGALDELAARLAAVVLRVDDGAAAPHLAGTAGLVATSVGTPVAELAVDGARDGLAFLAGL